MVAVETTMHLEIVRSKIVLRQTLQKKITDMLAQVRSFHRGIQSIVTQIMLITIKALVRSFPHRTE